MASPARAIVAALLLGLCPGDAVHASVEQAASATVGADGLRCLGASTMQPLVAAWANAFQARRLRAGQPRASIHVADTTRYSAAGVAAVRAGRANCVTFAREPFPAESAAFKSMPERAPIVVPVAGGSYATPHGTFAIAIYVNRANPLHGLTVAQLSAVFSGEPVAGGHQPLRTWGQLGLRGRWARRPIHVYGMTPQRASGNPPGIVNFLDRRVLGARPWRKDLRVQVDAHGLSALAAVVRQVSLDPDGIGYSGFGYATKSVNAIALSVGHGAPFVAGTPTSVASGRYALARKIYLGLPRTGTGGLTPLACNFLSFILGADGQRLIGQDRMHFDPLTARQHSAVRRLLAQDHLCDPPMRTKSTGRSPPHQAYVTSSGAIRIVGYNDMRWMLEALDRRFGAMHPGIHFDLVLKGTRTAPAALAAGSSLFAPMGAEFTDQALRQYRRRVGADPLRFRVAHAALDPRARSSPLAIYVNPANPLRTISMRQLRAIFTSPGRLAEGAQLGLGGAWAHWRIRPCGLAAGTALGVFMRRHHFGGAGYVDGYRGFRESAAVMRHVAADPAALCFADLNQANPGVRVVGIRLPAGAGVSRGSRQDIVSGRYPLDRHLYVYLRAPAAGDPLACAYLALMLSAQGQRIIAAAAPGYLPLSDAERASERRRLAGCSQPVMKSPSSL